MKNIKNTFVKGDGKLSKSYNAKKSQSISRGIADEKLSFKDGVELGSLSISIEDGATKRMVRRIVEKRVCKQYWKNRKNQVITDNRHRSATKRYVACVTRIIYGAPVEGFQYVA